VGVVVGTASLAFGIVIGLVTGYYRRLDRFVMRIMDGSWPSPPSFSPSPSWRSSRRACAIVIIALVIPEIPRWSAWCAPLC
jgi:peptide/nickel transport system permease protein